MDVAASQQPLLAVCHNQVDELKLTRIPVLIGEGIPLLGALPEANLAHIAKSDPVLSRYLLHFLL